MIFTLLTTLAFYALGAETNEMEPFQISIQDVSLDWSTKTISLDEQTLIFTKHFRSYESKYQIELSLIDIYKNVLIKRISVGNQNRQNYHPQIILINNFIYVAYVNQDLSIVKLDLKKYDTNLVEQQVYFTLGDSLENAQFDKQNKYIQLTQLNNTAFSIIWKSRGQLVNEFQWNYIKYDTILEKTTQILTFQDSKDISIAQNPLGIIGIVQISKQNLNITKIENDKITDVIQPLQTNYFDEIWATINIFSLPDGDFIIFQNRWDIVLTKYDRNLQESNTMAPKTYDSFCNNPNQKTVFYSQNYRLFVMSQGYDCLSYSEFDFSNKNFTMIQSRKISKPYFWSETYFQRIDEIGFNRFSLKWLNYNNYKYELNAIKLDMNIKQNECKQNCKLCDPQFKCLTCQDGYTFISVKNECVPKCPDNCDLCSDPSFCTKCKYGFQYTFENLCITPQTNMNELIISDEQFQKGQPKVSIKDNNILILYSLLENNKLTQLVLKRLNSQGVLIKQITIQQQQNEILDFDISSIDDVQYFHIIIKRLTVDSILQIIDYQYDFETLEVLNERILDVQYSLLRGKDQIRIIQLKNQEICYFYQTFSESSRQFLYYYVRIDENGNYINYIFQTDYSEINLIDISVSQNIINVYVLCQQSVNQYKIEKDQVNIVNQYQNQNENKQQKRYDSVKIQIEYDQYQNKQIFMNYTQFNPSKRIQINQSTRNIKLFSSSKFGQQYVILVWIGYSNVELQNPVSQVYIQAVNLQTQEMTNFKELICTKDCASCTDQGLCLECKNTKYQLQNGKCILTCENNCELCEVENQCLQCVNGFYLNENLLCDQTQQQDIYQQDNVILSYIASYDDSILQVSLKKNNSRYDIVFEEYNRQGQSKSGEVRISNDQEIVLLIRPKVLKVNNQIIIQYIRRNVYVENLGQFVILNDEYQYLNSFKTQGILFGNEDVIDFIASDDLILHVLYIQYTNQYWEGENIYLKYEQFNVKLLGNPILGSQTSRQITKIDKQQRVRNVQIIKNIYVQTLTVTYTFIEDNIESIKIVKINQSQDFLWLDLKEKFEYYLNNYKIWVVSYEKVNSNLIKVKFYNENQEMKLEHTIESQNQLSSFQIQLQPNFIYFIYTEQSTTNNNMNIQVIKYSLNGDQLNSRQIYNNELIIQDLLTSSSEDMVYLTWSSFNNNRVFKVRLNSELNTIPFVEQICNKNCEICDTNLICKQCQSDYQYNEIYNKCEPICAENCQSCRLPYTCDYCNGSSKFIDQKCTDISQLDLETSICQDSCYGLPSMIEFSDQSTIYSYQKYQDQQYKININIKQNTQNSIVLDQNLISQDQEITYHYLFLYEENQIALVWLSGNCQIQCRLMLQLFYKDGQVLSNPYELRIMKVKVSNFNLQIKKFNTDFLFLWTELDQNDKFQTMLGQYNQNNGFLLKFNINQNENDESSYANLIIQSGYYQIIYLQNNLKINALTVDGSINTYRVINTSERPILQLAVASSNYYGISIIWVEKVEMGVYLSYNYLQIQWFDQNLNSRGSQYTLLRSVQQITQLATAYYQSELYFIFTFLVQELNGQYRIRYKYMSYYENHEEYQLEQFKVGNILSQYDFEYGYRAYPQTNSFSILFSGNIGSSRQLFYLKAYQYSAPQDNCFQRNNKLECIWCKQGYQLFENQCQLQLKQHCVNGNNGICEVCDLGYILTVDGVCSLEDARYKEMKMNTYILQSKQRITTFKNGDYLTVWYRQYYENQGTGVFMSMFNAHGKKILDEKRISLSSAGIQIYPDVQALDNDQFCAVWIEGDLKVQAKIKIQRFTKDFVRIGDEIIVQENVQLKHAQLFDTPVMIQSIINGYVVVWTQNHLESNKMVEKLHVVFYDLQDHQQGFFVLNNQESIRNSEPVVASNNQIIVIVWQSDFGIIASKFSLNFVYISQEILSGNGQAPAICVLSDNKFIIAWRETVINSNDIMNQNIMFRRYSSDLNTWEFSNQIQIQDHNLNNPDLLSINNGFAIIFENRHAIFSNLRNLKMQLFNPDGYSISYIIDVFNEQDQYPHHPQLTQLAQGDILATWTLSMLQETSLQDDLYMKRYNGNGIQLPMDTVVCPQNCQQCNENDVCLVCMNDFVLNNNICLQSIPHCTSYSSNSVELVCQTCEADYKLTHNTCYKAIKLQQLNVEFVNEITSKFVMITFKNNDILFIWKNETYYNSQRFDQYGKLYSAPKQLHELSGPSSYAQKQAFDGCEIENNYFIVAYQFLNQNQIGVVVYDDSQTQLTQQFFTLNQQFNFGKIEQIVIVKYLGNNQVAIFYQEFEGSSNNIQLYMQIIQITGQYGATQIQFQQKIMVLSTQSYFQTFDVEIMNNHIKIWIENIQKSEIRYIYKIYDFFGSLVKTITKKNDNSQIEFKIMEVQDGSFLEVWTEISYSKYEVFYVIKVDNNNLFEPKKLSTSSELYKLDLKINILTNSIAVIWREGSYKADMTVNTNYKTVLISKQNYQQVTNPIQLNSDSFVKQGQDNFLSIRELPNKDIVIGWISYNILAKYNAISAVKLNQEGQILEFSQFRCSYGCQECTNLGVCLKCYNEEKYRLNGNGNCIIRQEKCENFEADCRNCLNGYYQNRYHECIEINQNVEIEVMDISSYSYSDYQIASYKNGTFVVASKYSDRSLGIRVYNQEGLLEKDYYMILEIPENTQMQESIMYFQFIINDQDVLTFGYVVGSQYQQLFISLVLEQFDNQLNKIGDKKIIPLNVYAYQTRLIMKCLQNNIIGISFKVDQKVIVNLLTSDISELIGNIAIQNSDTFDFAYNGEYVLYGYLENQCDLLYQPCTVIKVYDKQLRFIKDIKINDAVYVKMTINEQKQFIVLTQTQINVIDKATIIKSNSINQQSTLPNSIFVNQNNELVIFSMDQKETYTLLLTYYSQDGIIKKEVQVNMKKIEYISYGLFQIQNSDIIILFNGIVIDQQQWQSRTKIKLARFDQYGKSLSAAQIICPQNCELCFQTTTCNICKPGYNRNEQTLLCEKICTIEGCQSCENSNCDVCKDGMFFSFGGNCIPLIQDPSIDANVRYSLAQNYNVELNKKVLKFSNNEFALMYESNGYIKLTRFNAQGQELMFADLNVNSIVQSFDAVIVKNQIYIVIVTFVEYFSYQVYGLTETTQQFNLLFRNQLPQQITQVRIKGFTQNYVILVNSLDSNFGYLQCLTQSLYFYNELNELLDSKLNYNNPPTFTYEQCNLYKINNLYIYQDVLYTIITSQTSLKIIAMNPLGQIFQENPLEIPNVDKIEFALDSEQIVIIFKEIGKQSWNFRIMNTQFQTLFNQDDYIKGDLSVNMVMTSSAITIAWSQNKLQSIVEFVVLDRLGSKIKSNYINGQYSLKPLLTELDNQIICLVWSVWKNTQLWTLSYSLLDKTGQYVQFTHVICPQNCLKCSDSSQCQQCVDGFILTPYYKEDKQAYMQCSKACDPFCEFCDFGKCFKCKKNYYVNENGICVWNEFENKAIQINEFTSFSQITPNAAKFKDGSILIAWTSNNEDEDSWGVFGQLLNNQGQKIGKNFRVSQSVFGAQHSPQVAVLEDDTAIITFIEGNPEKQAMIKGIRFNNRQDIIGNEQLFATFNLNNFVLNQQFINKIVSLKNGGFVIIWMSNNQINLQFYDSASNLVIQTQIVDIIMNRYLEVAATTTELAILYRNIALKQFVSIYTQEGIMQSNIELLSWDSNSCNDVKLISISHYFALACIAQLPDQQQVKLQFYNNQFSSVGNQIIVVSSLFEQQFKYVYFDQILLYRLNEGALLLVSENRGGLTSYRQFYIDINWLVTELLTFRFNYQEQYTSTSSQIYVISNINDDQYFLYWNGLIESSLTQQFDITNIYIQRLSKQLQIVSIDQIVCSKDCRSCDTSNTCSQCLNQYTLQNEQCIPQCESNCLICIIPKICEVCQDGYYQQIQGKCSPIPVYYQEPQVLMNYSPQKNLVDLDVLPNGQTILYMQETLFDQQKEIFSLYIYQNNEIIKQMSVLTNTLTTNYYSTYQFYLEENYYLIFHYYDGIKIIKYNAQQEEVLNTYLQISSIDSSISIQNLILNPIQNNQYSLLYYKKGVGVFRILYDEAFNVIQTEQIWQQTLEFYNYWGIKGQLFVQRQNEKYTFTNSQVIQQTQQVCILSELMGYHSCDIYQLSNGNKIQITYGTQSLQYYSLYGNEMGHQVYYRILDDQYIPLTTEVQILENIVSIQQFAKIFIFQDSFILMVEQVNNYHSEILEIYSQRFDNAGMKIGEPKFVLFQKGWWRKFYKQTSTGYIIFTELKWFKTTSLPDDLNQATLYYKQFDQLGNHVSYSTNKNCIANCDKCINSYYCEQCNQNYQLDSSYKCKLTCQSNCNQCTSFTDCQSCNFGYKLINGSCVKLECVSNCAQCFEDTTSTTTICKLCNDNYILSSDNQQCTPICPSNCSQCNVPLECETCAFGYVVTSDKKCQQENSSILDQIKNTTVGTPLMATFPDGSYILMWYQNGDNAGVYFQLYSVDNIKVGDPMKVTGNTRRLLSQQSIVQNYYADIISIDYEFFVTWMDASAQSTDVKLKKFSSDGTAQTQELLLGTHQKTDLQDIKIPCQIKKTTNNSLLIAYMAKSDNEPDDFSMFISSYDQFMTSKTQVQEIKKVNQLSAPSIVSDENGIISLTYQSDGYVFVQQITQDGNMIDTPKAIADSSSINLRVTNLENGIMVFLWENKNLQLSQPQFILNYQLISKDLKTRSEVKSVGDVQIASLTPDIQSFNDGFIIAWKITDSNYKSIGLEFQIYDSMGVSSSQVIEVQIEGIYPQIPRIQIINENQFAVTWTAKNIDSDGTILGDGIFMQKYNKYGTLITDSSSSTDLCSYQCQSCQSPLVCLKCQYGFYLNKNNQCIMDCGAFCDSCEIPWTCQACKNGYQLNNNEACIETECSEGFFRNTNTKLCEPKCPDECDQCSVPNICVTCKSGYSLSDSTCLSNTVNMELDDQSTIMAIVIIILAAAFISVSACSITLYCKYKKLLKQPSFSQVHPVQDINKSVSNISCNASVIRLRQHE